MTSGRWVASKPAATGYKQHHLEINWLSLAHAARVLNALLAAAAVAELSATKIARYEHPQGDAANYLTRRVHRSLYPAGERGSAGEEWTSGLRADWFGMSTVTVILRGWGMDATANVVVHATDVILVLALDEYTESLPIMNEA
ncbi:hypothetical protein [Streptomyces sp. NPDC056707]|uniref:hypothetical protein n=1 Tax=Streptomyces sp. NPDC056707 TaxID=3345919 RepID=UPI0036866C95